MYVHHRQPIPVLPEQGYTKLDVNMREYRKTELVSMIFTYEYVVRFVDTYIQNAILYEARHLLQSHGTSPDIETNLSECEEYLHRLLSLCIEVR